MRVDFSSLPLRNRAFSQKPMTFMDQEAKNFLSAILDLAAIETGNRAAREFWQRRQLQNLLAHAAERSSVWRRRIGRAKISGINLADLPVQSRADVVEQVSTEGALARMNEVGANEEALDFGLIGDAGRILRHGEKLDLQSRAIDRAVLPRGLGFFAEPHARETGEDDGAQRIHGFMAKIAG